MSRVEGGGPVDPADYTSEEKTEVDNFLELLRLFFSGDMTEEELRDFLDYIRTALDDPTLGPLLQAMGIDAEYLDKLEAGLDSDADFDPMDWMHLFDMLGELGDSGEFGISDSVRFVFADYALERLAIAVGEENNAQARITYADRAEELIDALISSGVETSFSPEFIELLINSGFTSEDTENETLKHILDSEDPIAEAENHNFSVEEMTDIKAEISTHSDEMTDALDPDTLIDLQILTDLRDELQQMVSNMVEARHNGMMAMIDNFGSI